MQAHRGTDAMGDRWLERAMCCTVQLAVYDPVATKIISMGSGAIVSEDGKIIRFPDLVQVGRQQIGEEVIEASRHPT